MNSVDRFLRFVAPELDMAVTTPEAHGKVDAHSDRSGEEPAELAVTFARASALGTLLERISAELPEAETLVGSHRLRLRLCGLLAERAPAFLELLSSAPQSPAARQAIRAATAIAAGTQPQGRGTESPFERADPQEAELLRWLVARVRNLPSAGDESGRWPAGSVAGPGDRPTSPGPVNTRKAPRAARAIFAGAALLLAAVGVLIGVLQPWPAEGPGPSTAPAVAIFPGAGGNLLRQGLSVKEPCLAPGKALCGTIIDKDVVSTDGQSQAFLRIGGARALLGRGTRVAIVRLVPTDIRLDAGEILVAVAAPLPEGLEISLGEGPSIRVTGTTFSVRRSPHSVKTVVAVLEGSVSIGESMRVGSGRARAIGPGGVLGAERGISSGEAQRLRAAKKMTPEGAQAGEFPPLQDPGTMRGSPPGRQASSAVGGKTLRRLIELRLSGGQTEFLDTAHIRSRRSVGGGLFEIETTTGKRSGKVVRVLREVQLPDGRIQRVVEP